MIIHTVSQDDFVQAFDRMGRGDNFSFVGRRALFDYLEELSEDTEEPIQLDVIALCVEFSEHDEEELMREHGDPLRRAPNQYIYTVDLDERGEYRATIYRLPEDLAAEPVEVTRVFGDDFDEGGRLEGVDTTDHEGQIYELTGDALATTVADEDEAETEGQTLEDLLDDLRDQTTVIEVEHYDAEPTYIIGEY